jgi:hypothetical protein
MKDILAQCDNDPVRAQQKLHELANESQLRRNLIASNLERLMSDPVRRHQIAASLAQIINLIDPTIYEQQGK